MNRLVWLRKPATSQLPSKRRALRAVWSSAATLLLIALLWPGLAQAQVVGTTATFGSTQAAARADTTSNYVDWWQVRTGPGLLISVFGYNSGAQQWLQFFDSAHGPTVAVTAWDSTLDVLRCTNHGLVLGDRIQLTGTVAGIAAGIYYVHPLSNDSSFPLGADRDNDFFLYDTLAHARAGGATGLEDVTGATSTATLNRLPVHTFAIAATDNYSCVVISTGMSFDRGIVVANSTTAATYTAGSKNLTIFVTFKQP